jgi:DNA-binding MarR family transcriptional regulator
LRGASPVIAVTWCRPSSCMVPIPSLPTEARESTRPRRLPASRRTARVRDQKPPGRRRRCYRRSAVEEHPLVATTARHLSRSPARDDDAAPLDERQLRAWRGMLRVHATLTKALDAQLEAEHGLALTSYEVLMYLNDAEGRRMRMSDLASTVILSRSGLTRLVDRLERDGLIERQSCPSDARGSFASLTEAGRQRLQAARATHLAGVRSLFLDHFSEADLDALGSAWERVLPGVSHASGPSCG